MKLLITGGAGFIGSNLVHHALHLGHSVMNIDKLTYAGNSASLVEAGKKSSYTFVKGDICDQALMDYLFKEYCPDAVLHLAAESHVDRSIDGPSIFVTTNVVGTSCMLNSARQYWESLSSPKRESFRFIHISTDEVFGSLGLTGFFNEETPYDPRSPYSASKASSDHLARAYYHTYGLPVIITNCSNNYGPFQFPEKLIPLVINNAIREKALPIYGDGRNIRDWLYVEDHCRALLTVLEKGHIGETYAIGGNNEQMNIEIVTTICDFLDAIRPRESNRSYKELITFVRDRPGHDRRYAIDTTKIQRDLNWEPSLTFEEGIKHTIVWYLEHQSWVENILLNTYQMERLG